MKKIALTFALLMLGSLASAVTIYSDFAWVFGEDLMDHYQKVISPLKVELTLAGSSQEYIAKVPDGGIVKYWTYGTDVNSFKASPNGSYGVKEENSSLTGSNFVFMADINMVNQKECNVGVVIDYFPFTVSFDANEGQGTMSKLENCYYTNNIPLPANEFVKTGYDFAGWSLTKGGSVTIADKTTVTGKELGVKHNDKITLYAVWQARKTTVTFQNGGGGSEPSGVEATYDQPLPTITPPQYAGHDFGGYFDDSECKGTQYYKSTGVGARNWDKEAAAIVLYAYWTKHQYVLKILPSEPEGSGSIEGYGYGEHKVACGTGVTLKPKATDGYSFKQWTDGDEHNPRELVMDCDLELGAVFTARVYAVTFNYRDQSGEPTNTVVYAEYRTRAEPPAEVPDYPGMAFSGKWEPETYTNVTKNLEVTAVYTGRMVRVSFDSNGGTECEPKEIQFGDAAVYGDLPTPEREHYDFVNWTNATGNVIRNATKMTRQDDHVLYAEWKGHECRVDLDYRNPDERRYYLGTYEYGQCMEKAIVSGGDKPQTGYGLVGFFTEPGGAGRLYLQPKAEHGLEWVPGIRWEEDVANCTLYAYRTNNQYTVTLDANGGSLPPGADDKVTVSYDRELGALPEPVWKGHQFNGWTLAGDLVSPATIYKQAEDSVLVASWQTNRYRVAYFGNGGTNELGDVQSQDFVYGAAQNLASNTFARVGYAFRGWDFDPTNAVETADFPDGAKVVDLTDEPNGIVRLYARWEKIRAGEVTSELSKWINCQLELGDLSAEEQMATNWVRTVKDEKNCLMAEIDCPAGAFDDKEFSCWGLETVAPCDGFLSFHVRTSIFPDDQEDRTTIFYYYQDEDMVCKTNDTAEFVIENCRVIRGQKCWWKVTPPMKERYWVVPHDYVLIDRIDWVPDQVITGVGLTFRRNDGTAAPDDIVTNITCMAGSAIGDRLPVPSFDESEREFLGWYTNIACLGEAIGSEWIVPNVSNVELFAKWVDRDFAYYVILDGNGATNVVMATNQYEAGQSAVLPPNAYVRENYEFRGWTTNAASRLVAYGDGAEIGDSELAVVGATNTLYAVWWLTDLATALDSTNLAFTTVGASKWEVSDQSPTCGEWCVWHGYRGEVATAELVTVAPGKGILKFFWKMPGGDELVVAVGENAYTVSASKSTANQWNEYAVDVGDAEEIRFTHECGEGYECYLDGMRWLPASDPEPPEPVDPDDRADFTGVVTKDGKLAFALSAFDERFTYELLATNELSSADWPVVRELDTKEFELEIGDAPQMFYRVRVRAKKKED